MLPSENGGIGVYNAGTGFRGEAEETAGPCSGIPAVPHQFGDVSFIGGKASLDEINALLGTTVHRTRLKRFCSRRVSNRQYPYPVGVSRLC